MNHGKYISADLINRTKRKIIYTINVFFSVKNDKDPRIDRRKKKKV